MLADRLDLDNFGWRDLWAYITAAPPGTAIYHARNEGFTIGDHMAAETLYEVRKLGWRYTAVHFEGGGGTPFPERIPRPGVTDPEQSAGPTWSTAELDDIVTPQVQAMLRGESPFLS